MSRSDELFRLLDPRGCGSVSLDVLVAFTKPFRRTLPFEDVTAAFQMYARDSSGGLDAPALLKCLRAVEAKCNVSMEAASERYVEDQYRVLFELVDEDGTGALRREQVKPLLDSLVTLLGLKTMCDAGIIFRGVGVGIHDEISFVQFRSAVAKIIGATPITHVIEAFRDARNRRRAVRGRKDTPPPPTLHSTRSGFFGSHSHCGECQSKAQTMALLEDRVAKLEALLDAERRSVFNNSSAASRDELRHVAPLHIRDSELCAVSEDAGVNGKLQRHALSTKLLHGVLQTCNAASAWQRDPGSISPLIENTHNLQAVQITCVTRIVSEMAVVFHCSDEQQEETLTPSTSVSEHADDEHRQLTIHSWPDRVQKLLEHAATLVESRDALARMCIGVAQVSAHRRRILAAATTFQEATAEYLQVLLRLRGLVFALPSQRSNSVAVLAPVHQCPDDGTAAGVASSSAVDAAVRSLQSDIPVAVQRLSQTLHEVNGAALSHFTKMKDKSCQVAMAATSAGHMDPVTGDMGDKDVTRLGSRERCLGAVTGAAAASFSRPPRFRGKRAWEGRGPERIDALVSHTLMRGTEVPPNFGRVTGPKTVVSPGSPPRGSTELTNKLIRNLFQFGTKKIELVAADDNTLCVQVGGGFLKFEEYCRQHTEFESALLSKRSASPTFHRI